MSLYVNINPDVLDHFAKAELLQERHGITSATLHIGLGKGYCAWVGWKQLSVLSAEKWFPMTFR